MAEHVKVSEAELNELLAAYWNLRHQTGLFLFRLVPLCANSVYLEVYVETLSNKLGIAVS